MYLSQKSDFPVAGVNIRASARMKERFVRSAILDFYAEDIENVVDHPFKGIIVLVCSVKTDRKFCFFFGQFRHRNLFGQISIADFEEPCRLVPSFIVVFYCLQHAVNEIRTHYAHIRANRIAYLYSITQCGTIGKIERIERLGRYERIRNGLERTLSDEDFSDFFRS